MTIEEKRSLTALMVLGATLIVTPLHWWYPNLGTCLLHWLFAFTWLIFWSRAGHKLYVACVSPGMALNALVTFANNGYMPVSSEYVTQENPLWGIHSALTDSSRLAFLADVFPPGGASPGDYLMTLGMCICGLIIMARWLRRRGLTAQADEGVA